LSDLGALRRSASIEHFLGPAFRGERRGIDTCLAEPQARRKPPGPPSRWQTPTPAWLLLKPIRHCPGRRCASSGRACH